MANFDQFSDIIQVEDIVARIKELQGADYLDESENEELEELEESENEELEELEESENEELEELEELLTLMDELQGCGGDFKWRGDWYPAFLIRDSHFQDYAQELAEDCDLLKNATSWPLTCIDWEKAARELKYDYSCADFRGVTFWFR